jgi:fatty acid desaturase
MDAPQYLGATPLFPRAKYVADLRTDLPAAAFAPSHSRLAWMPLHLALITVASLAIALHWVPWALAPVLALAIGISFSCLTFVAHETLHGGVVRNKVLQRLVGWIGFLPFALSPTLWVAWHNNSHHGNTNSAIDPDGYPTLAEYNSHAGARFAVDAFSLGGSRWRGGLSLILGFTVQSAHQLYVAQRSKFLDPRRHAIAIVESALALGVWVTVAALVGFLPFVFIFVIPHLVANVCVMAFILTNHSLSPRIPVNDPLVSGLSVTSSKFVEWVTLRFGYHVEHHLFPAMSSRHAHLVRSLVLARWPERYQAMPLGTAMLALHRTGRVYKDDVTLVDPRTGGEFPVLLPR